MDVRRFRFVFALEDDEVFEEVPVVFWEEAFWVVGEFCVLFWEDLFPL